MRALPQGAESPSYSLRPLFVVSGGARLPCKPQGYAPLHTIPPTLRGTGAYERLFFARPCSVQCESSGGGCPTPRRVFIKGAGRRYSPASLTNWPAPSLFTELPGRIVLGN